ncbi:Uncharacterised protein [Streptococcus pneumoniae]|nr:Uncharacterised protein [Streptococcus pneumoniae]
MSLSAFTSLFSMKATISAYVFIFSRFLIMSIFIAAVIAITQNTNGITKPTLPKNLIANPIDPTAKIKNIAITCPSLLNLTC